MSNRDELVPEPSTGRVFRTERRVSIADADSAGRMELDAVARFLQDAGNDDTDDAALPELGLAWVARRGRFVVRTPAVAREALSITTWCSGTGRRWAERRTTLIGADGARIDAAVVWVHVDTTTGRPVRWGEDFAERYLEAAQGREVDAKLRLPKRPLEHAARHSWRFRRTDHDAFGHVNNAAYLAVAEELVTERLAGPADVEIEWRSPSWADESLTAHVGDERDSAILHLSGADPSDVRTVISVSPIRD